MANEYEHRLEEKREAKRQRRARDRGVGNLSNFRLKVIGAVLLFLGAASTTIVPLFLGVPTDENMVGLTGAVLCEVVSWAAVPIYAWLLYSGFDHTHNQLLYAVQLLVLALVCEVPYDICNTHAVVDLSSQNPVWGLLIALIVVMLLEAIRDYPTGAKVVLSVLVILVGLAWNYLFRIGQTGLLMNIGMLTLGFVVIFYYLDGRENSMLFTAGALGAVCLIAPGVGVAVLHYRNDELGYGHAWDKWVFYCIYPVILAACALIVM